MDAFVLKRAHGSRTVLRGLVRDHAAGGAKLLAADWPVLAEGVFTTPSARGLRMPLLARGAGRGRATRLPETPCTGCLAAGQRRLSAGARAAALLAW